MFSYHAALIFSQRIPTLIIPVFSKNFAHGNIVPAIWMLCAELQDQQIIEGSFILPTPMNSKEKTTENKLIKESETGMSLNVYKVLR